MHPKGGIGLKIVDATATATAIRSGELSPVEAVSRAIERAEQNNGEVNAIIHKRYERALEEASHLDRDTPFCGVPIVVKDLGAAMAGEPYHLGSRFLAQNDFRAKADAYLVRRLMSAGFVIIGRTNAPEFGTLPTTEPLAYGPTRNPHDLRFSAGGSSGGSAAAVASGIVTVAHGNDGGGSIRIPASCCGVVGLKPTRGRISRGPQSGEGWAGLSVDGVLTRTVRDQAALLDVISGFEPGDPYAVAGFNRPLVEEVGKPPGRLNIGYFAGSFGDLHPDPEVVVPVHETVELLEALGHRVSELPAPHIDATEFVSRIVNVMSASLAHEIEQLSEEMGLGFDISTLEPHNAFYYAVGQEMKAASYLATLDWFDTFRREMAAYWEGHLLDVLVTPTLGTPPPVLGYLTDDKEGAMRTARFAMFTPQFNVTGQPAISLPVGRTQDGLPIGVQFVARFGREDLLIRVASQLEEAGAFKD